MATIRIDTGDFESGLNNASNMFKKAGETITKIGSTLTKSVTLPIAAIGTAILKAGMDYEAGMSEVQAISGATAAEMGMLGEKAMEMASKTKFSTAEAAEAYKYMAMAGWETGDMVNSLSGIMNLAAASNESLAATSDIVTDAMTAFQLSADGTSKVMKDGYVQEVSNADRFTNVLAATANNSNTNVSLLGETFKYVANVAGPLGYSIEDAALAIGLMANTGVKGSMAGTALRTVMTNLAKPTKDVQTAMDVLNISIEDGEGNMYSFREIIGQLRESFAGGSLSAEEFTEKMSQLSDSYESGQMDADEYAAATEQLAIAMYGAEGAQKAEYAAMIAGKYGMSGLLAIVSATEEDYNKLAGAIDNSSDTFVKLKDGSVIPLTQALAEGVEWVEEYSGTTEKMASVMQDNAAGAVAKLESAINVLFTELSKNLIPVFTSVVEKLTDAVVWFGNLDEKTQKTILTIAGVAAAVGPVLVIIGNVITAISTITGALSGLGGVISGVSSVVSAIGSGLSSLWGIMIANPIALVIAAVAALAAGFIYLWNTSEDFRNFWIGLWDKIKEVASAAWEAITGFFKDAWEAIKDAWNSAGEFFGGIVDGIRTAFEGIGEFLGGLFTDAWEAIQAVWDGAIDFFSNIWDGIQNAFSTVVDVLGGFFSDAWEAVQSAWDSAVEFFGSVWDGIQDAFSKVSEVLGGFFSDAWDAVSGAWDAAKEFFGDIWNNIKDKAKDAADKAKEALKNAWENIKTAWGTATEFFGDIWNNIKEKGGETAEKVKEAFKQGWENIKSAWGDVKEFFSKKWDDVKNIFKDALSHFKDIGKNIVSGIKEGISNAWGSLTSWTKDKFDGLISGVKNTLGVHSPSTVFAGIGSNMALGLKIGWEDEYSGIKKTIESGLNFGTASVSLIPNSSNSSVTSYGQNNAIQANGTEGGNTIFNFTFNSPEALDPVSAAKEAKKAAQQIALQYV